MNFVLQNYQILYEQKLFHFPAPPVFLKKPLDQRVGLNGVARFDCEVEGNPKPSVFWTKEGSQTLMFPGNAYGRLHVSPEGTLNIQGVQREDSGYLVCSALSAAGSDTARAFLQVLIITRVITCYYNYS